MTKERLIEIIRALELRLVHDELDIVIDTKFVMDGTVERDYDAKVFNIETQYTKADAVAIFKELAAAGLITDYESASDILP